MSGHADDLTTQGQVTPIRFSCRSAANGGEQGAAGNPPPRRGHVWSLARRLPELDRSLEDNMTPQQSHFDKMPRNDLEELAMKQSVPDIQNKAKIALRKLDQSEADGLADRRHQEAIEESRASRRLDKWALSVAVIALIVSGVGLWRSFLPQEPAHLLPGPVSLTPVGPADSTSATTPKISKPSRALTPAQRIQKPDEKLKIGQPLQK